MTIIQMPGTDPMQGGDPMHTCTARTRSGKRCSNRPILGSTVCRMHGGSAPQVQNAAKLRLLALIDPAISVLAGEMDNAMNSSADRQRAANSILDRAGMTRGAPADAEVLRALIIDRLMSLSQEAS